MTSARTSLNALLCVLIASLATSCTGDSGATSATASNNVKSNKGGGSGTSPGDTSQTGGTSSTGSGTGGGGTSTNVGSGGESDPGAQGATIGGLKMLTHREYNATVSSLLGLGETIEVVPQIGSKSLPMNAGEVFENDFQSQSASEVLVKGARTFAGQLSAYALSRDDVRQKLLPCQPQDSEDINCYEAFIEEFSQKALRRSLKPDERAALMVMFKHGQEDRDIDVALDYAIRFFLQHVEFLYRNEQGDPVPNQAGLYRLTSQQVATRMAFVLWGEGPDEPLLTQAAQGKLDTVASRAQVATEMLKDPRALRQIQHFHARWLGYDGIQLALPGSMRQESDLLVKKIIETEDGDWRGLFTAKGTYMNDELAGHYGFDAPGSQEMVWVTYPSESQRAGILSHGSFLSVRASVGKTSITKRGKFIAEHLLCNRIADPPPNIDTDERAPGIEEDACKQEEHEYLTDFDKSGLCASCHVQMDPIAMGIEQFGPTGKLRQFEEGLSDPFQERKECEIKGKGSVQGIGDFEGPAQLGKVLVEDTRDRLASCAVRRAYQFAHGLPNEPIKSPTTDYIYDQFKKSGYNWRVMLVAMVSTESFVHRREELDPKGQYWPGPKEALKLDPKDADVEYAIRYTDTPPTVDGSCSDFVGSPIISWKGLDQIDEGKPECWMLWSKASDNTANIHTCCTIRDQNVIAEHQGRETDHDFSDTSKPEIFTDDHFTYMLSGTGGMFDEKTTQVAVTPSLQDVAIYDLFYNEGFYSGVVQGNPVYESKATVKQGESWTVEFSATSKFSVTPEDGLDILCRFRITDVDQVGGELSHLMATGEQNNITSRDDLVSCRLSTSKHVPTIAGQ